MGDTLDRPQSRVDSVKKGVGGTILALNLTSSLSPRGFRSRPCFGGGIECQFNGLKLAHHNDKINAKVRTVLSKKDIWIQIAKSKPQ